MNWAGNLLKKKECKKTRKNALVQENTHLFKKKNNLFKKKRTRSRKHVLDQDSVQEKDKCLLFSLTRCVFSCFLTFYFFSIINFQPKSVRGISLDFSVLVPPTAVVGKSVTDRSGSSKTWARTKGGDVKKI